MYEVLLQSPKVWCNASLETRVRRLIDEYGRPDYRDGMADALQRIKKRLGPDKYAEISGYLQRWELEPFTAELIRHYYDKVYYKTRSWREDAVISLEDYSEAELELERFINEHVI
jgi:tRNA 2-selenouridine synthase